MKKIKAASFPGQGAFINLINRFQTPASFGSVLKEVYPLEEIEAELKTACSDMKKAQFHLADIVHVAKSAISENSGKVKKAISEVETVIKACDERRKNLLRESLDECDSKRKETINKEIISLRAESSDNTYRLEILNEKLNISTQIPQSIADELNKALGNARAAEQIVINLKRSLLESLDSSIYELVSKGERIHWDLTDRRDCTADRLIQESGLFTEKVHSLAIPKEEPHNMLNYEIHH